MLQVRALSLFSLLTITGAIFVLFTIKDKAGSLSYQLSEITKELERERDKIYLLKAEYTYLRSPERIRNLAEKFLNLSSVKSSQIIKDPITTEQIEIVNKKIALSLESLSIKNKKKAKWRYKKSNGKYLQTISLKP